MKAFIIYIPDAQSIEYADAAKQSFLAFNGWSPELFLGITPETLSVVESQYNIKTKPRSRATDFYNNNYTTYTTKKCCSLNHYILFKKCVVLNEPIAIIEHDAHCVGDWQYEDFDDILVMNICSALTQSTLLPIINMNKCPTIPGINNININGLNYRHDPDINGAHMMPGTAAYAVTPHGAQKMIEVYENIGWEQSDFIINTAYVTIQTIVPELFTFKLPNLSMSHGSNNNNKGKGI